jgi:hypothetical protein
MNECRHVSIDLLCFFFFCGYYCCVDGHIRSVGIVRLRTKGHGVFGVDGHINATELSLPTAFILHSTRMSRPVRLVSPVDRSICDCKFADTLAALNLFSNKPIRYVIEGASCEGALGT